VVRETTPRHLGLAALLVEACPKAVHDQEELGELPLSFLVVAVNSEPSAPVAGPVNDPASHRKLPADPRGEGRQR
jgi:hypothetical protein